MPVDHLDLIKRYALSGLEHWKSKNGDFQKETSEILLNQIANSKALVSRTVRSRGKNHSLFIPMRRVHHNDFKFCFFLPRPVDDEDMAFDLFLLVDDQHSLGFRFEPSDPVGSTHNYSHVQLNEKMNGRTLLAKGIPSWIPDSYPAFAIRASDPKERFLSMLTSVHGYEKEVTDILREIFHDRPNHATECLETLSEMLGKTAN